MWCLTTQRLVRITATLCLLSHPPSLPIDFHSRQFSRGSEQLHLPKLPSEWAGWAVRCTTVGFTSLSDNIALNQLHLHYGFVLTSLSPTPLLPPTFQPLLSQAFISPLRPSALTPQQKAIAMCRQNDVLPFNSYLPQG